MNTEKGIDNRKSRVPGNPDRWSDGLVRAALTAALAYALILGVTAPASADFFGHQSRTERWGVFELTLHGPKIGNPYLDIRLNAEFRRADPKTGAALDGGTPVIVPGFYNGHGQYIIRFSPPGDGFWTYVTDSNAPKLDQVAGRLLAVPPKPGNHGPVRPAGRFHFRYADGTPYLPVGTTAYQWTSVSQHLQHQTLHSLSLAPFNKIRMLFFPKWYGFGNRTQPFAQPFEAREGARDFTRPNYAFFDNFDKRVRDLMDKGIEADVILFHPYDAADWGYANMGQANDERFVRYMIARLAAYRNVWWSAANEFDIMERRGQKSRARFNRILQILKQADPYGHLRSIHNFTGNPKRYFDYTSPLVTHVSLQTSRFPAIPRLRRRYQKPILFDEMGYEGGVPKRWGNLSAREMTRRFWLATLFGAYATHGETLESAPGVRWWAKGGRLVGQSVPRIAFYKQIMESLPFEDMAPVLPPTGPDGAFLLAPVLAKPGSVYLAFAPTKDQPISVRLAPPAQASSNYKVERIDIWNMTREPAGETAPGKVILTPTQDNQAFLLTAQEPR